MVKINWEAELSKTVFKYLKNGRSNWDEPHTKAVVYWAKRICKQEKVDSHDYKIIISSAYLHDIGYSFTNVRSEYNSVEAAKKDHMIIGATEAKKILSNLNHYNQGETNEIVNIVKNHDIIDRILTDNEQILIEADSLAQLDRDRVRPNFNQADYDRFIRQFQSSRIPIIKTKTGKEILALLWVGARDYKIKN